MQKLMKFDPEKVKVWSDALKIASKVIAKEFEESEYITTLLDEMYDFFSDAITDADIAIVRNKKTLKDILEEDESITPAMFKNVSEARKEGRIKEYGSREKKD